MRPRSKRCLYLCLMLAYSAIVGIFARNIRMANFKYQKRNILSYYLSDHIVGLLFAFMIYPRGGRFEAEYFPSYYRNIIPNYVRFTAMIITMYYVGVLVAV